MRTVIVPGIGGSGDQHWQTAWEAADATAVRIRPASWDQPDPVDWSRAIGDAVDRQQAAASASDDPDGVVIVAHSMGCLAAAEWCARNPGRVAAAFLVAPPDPAAEVYPREADGFVTIAQEPVGGPALLVVSEDDPYGGRAYADALAGRWGVELVSVGALGHINSASGLADWPGGRRLLATLVHGDPQTSSAP